MILFFYIARLFLSHFFLWVFAFLVPCLGFELLDHAPFSAGAILIKISFLVSKFIIFALFFSVFSVFFLLRHRGELVTFLSTGRSMITGLRSILMCSAVLIFLDVFVVSPRGCDFLNQFLKNQSPVSIGAVDWSIRPYNAGYALSSRKKPFHVFVVDGNFSLLRYAMGQERSVAGKDLCLRSAFVWDIKEKKKGERTIVFKDFFKQRPYLYKDYITTSLPDIIKYFFRGDRCFLLRVRAFFWATHIVWCFFSIVFAFCALWKCAFLKPLFLYRFFCWCVVFIFLFVVREWSVASSFLMSEYRALFALSFVPVLMAVGGAIFFSMTKEICGKGDY